MCACIYWSIQCCACCVPKQKGPGADPKRLLRRGSLVVRQDSRSCWFIAACWPVNLCEISSGFWKGPSKRMLESLEMKTIASNALKTANMFTFACAMNLWNTFLSYFSEVIKVSSRMSRFPTAFDSRVFWNTTNMFQRIPLADIELAVHCFASILFVYCQVQVLLCIFWFVWGPPWLTGCFPPSKEVIKKYIE